MTGNRLVSAAPWRARVRCDDRADGAAFALRHPPRHGAGRHATSLPSAFPPIAGVMLMLATCSSPTDSAASDRNVTVVAGTSANAATTAPRGTTMPTTIAAVASPDASAPRSMPLPRYVPAPPLPPELQGAEDEIRRATLQATVPPRPDR